MVWVLADLDVVKIRGPGPGLGWLFGVIFRLIVIVGWRKATCALISPGSHSDAYNATPEGH